ncbi:MAG: hypothetical protein JWN94_2104 [Betaproteobacteria bacterium]|nr:hypothetical protein [Betaproteobacteria bacterium]
MRLLMRCFLVFASSGAPLEAWAHAFEERYDLPAPLSYFTTGAAAVVILSFVIAQIVVDHTSDANESRPRRIALGWFMPAMRVTCRVLALLIFMIAIFAGLKGTADPLMNLTPTLVWIVWWVGLSLIVALVGNVWPAFDPIRTVYDALNVIVRRAGGARGLTLGMRYPETLGAWPAMVLLLAVGWFEVAYPQAAVPYKLACALLAWSAFTFAGMVCFGADIWQRNADVFAVYFATLGRFAPFAADRQSNSLIVRPPGRGLIDEPAHSLAVVCFVVAMLSTVLFDGLMSGQIWQITQIGLKRIAPFLVDPDGYRMGAAGLIGIWLIFAGAYALSCAVTSLLLPEQRAATIARLFALTLVPIAIGYNIAHNFANFAVQAQQLVALVSDPLGEKWDLFGTANFRADIGLIDARLTWYIAIAAIVLGHVISIWLAHRLALRKFGSRRQAALATVPLTLLMVGYTIVSLSVIAEPMVKFDLPDTVISR